MIPLAKLETPYGARYVDRIAGEFVRTLPTLSAPHGEWWKKTPHWSSATSPGDWRPVASNNRDLQAALEKAAA